MTASIPRLFQIFLGALAILLAGAAIAPATPVVGFSTDVTQAPFVGRINTIQFKPLAVSIGNGTNTIFPCSTGYATITNGLFGINLNPGWYYASPVLLSTFGPVIHPIAIYVPNDTNIWQFNACANLANYAIQTGQTNIVIIVTATNVSNASGTNVSFEGNFTDVNGSQLIAANFMQSGSGGYTLNGSYNPSTHAGYAALTLNAAGPYQGLIVNGGATIYGLGVPAAYTTSLDGGGVVTDGNGNLSAVSFTGTGAGGFLDGSGGGGFNEESPNGYSDTGGGGFFEESPNNGGGFFNLTGKGGVFNHAGGITNDAPGGIVEKSSAGIRIQGAGALTVSSGIITNGVVVWLTTNGLPIFSAPNGSLCTRTDTGQLYVRTNSTWVGK
jgi:hypothetical protein